MWHLPISVISDISPCLPNVFMSHGSSTYLISGGQLVDHDYNIHFSHSSYVIQDQVIMVTPGCWVLWLFLVSKYCQPLLVP